jgi:hypothetical protein
LKANDTLYILVSYFNYNSNKSREKNIYSFIEKNSNSKAKIVIIEGIYNNLNELKDLNSQVFLHLKYKIKHPISLQDNLINVGIKKLPEDWEYLAWVDSDVIFNNENWTDNILKQLQNNDIVHCFKEADFLNQDGTPANFKFLSECYTHINNFKYLDMSQRHHCGFAWAFKKSFYKQIKEIFDYSIIGSNDVVMNFVILKKSLEDYFLNSGYSKEYIDLVTEYYNRKKEIKFTYIDNKITHLWHGEIKNRNYQIRKNILKKYQFNPKQHILRNDDGIIELTEKGLIMLPYIKNYFELKEKEL